MSELPKGWISSSLGSVSTVVRGITFPASAKEHEHSASNVCCLRTSNIQRDVEWGNIYFVNRSFVKRDEQFVQSGDVLMSMANSYELVGKVAIAKDVPYPTAFGAFLSSIRPTSVIGGKYLFHLLRTSQVQSELRQGSSQTTNIANISVGTLAAIEIPLAPLTEQKRIADKLDTVLARVDACRDRLDRLPALLKRFRQSILAAATSGRLTEDWRRSDAPANDARRSSDLLNQIFQEQLAVKSGNRGGKIEPQLSDLPDEIDLPDSWQVAGFDSLAAPERNALKAGPFGSALKKSMYVPSGYKIYGQEQVISGDENFGDYYIDADKFQELSSCAVKSGDILISLVGTIGRVLILSESAKPGIINPRLVKLSLHPAVSRTYIAMYLASPIAQHFFAKQSHGGTMDILNLGILRELPILFPPPEEQHEIVRCVEILFAFADRLEARLASARKQVEQLTPALLAKAFRGELVAQDPADEPASELLKRLAVQHAAAPATKRGRGRASIAATSGDIAC